MTELIQVQPGRINGVGQAPARGASHSSQAAQGPNFSEVLDNVQGVRFSSHAQKRLLSREINLNNENVNRLSDAIDKAEKRGGKSSLVVVDDLAFIVNVPNRTVVTALTSAQRGEGVFTQIDSVVFADPSKSSSQPSIDIKG